LELSAAGFSPTVTQSEAGACDSNDAFSFSFANTPGATFSVLATTNMTVPANTWTTIGVAAETPPGSSHYEFTDSQTTNNPQRFYRVVWP
jgi:hypothetical protein